MKTFVDNEDYGLEISLKIKVFMNILEIELFFCIFLFSSYLRLLKAKCHLFFET